MGVYFGETEITNIDNLVPQKIQDNTQAFFGSTEIFTVWGEYDGTLPATYNANGDYLADYRIYGADGGVGDATSGTELAGYKVPMSITGNIYHPEDADPNNGYMSGYYMQATGEPAPNNSWHITEYISIDPGKKYVVDYAQQGYYTGMAFYDSQKNYLSGQGYMGQKPFTLTVPQNAVYARFSIIEPTYYQSSSIEESETILIYIGSSPLNAYEYIDYASGKIYRWSSNQLSVPEVREKTNEEVTCTVSNNGVYTLTVSDTVQRDRILSFSYSPVETPDGKTWVVAAFAENILDDNGMITLGDAIHPVASAYIRNNGYNVNRASSPSATTYILDRMAITVRAGTPAGTFTLRPMLMYIEPTDPPVPLPALPTVDGVNIVGYAGQSAVVPSRLTAKYRKQNF